MPINSLSFATKFAGELDKVLIQKAGVGFFADNAMKAQFIGAKTVKIPRLSTDGLGDYDRDGGFVTGAIEIAHDTFELSQDRARSFTLDREDCDETGVAELAGSIMGEFVRTKVVPEVDAYTISKLYGVANTESQTIEYTTAYETFEKLLAAIQDKIGMDEELVCFVNTATWQELKTDDAVTKMIDVGNFKKGGVDLSVKTLDGVTILPMPSARMNTAISLNDGTTTNQKAGGYVPGGTGVKMLMLPKRGASLVEKSKKVRTFTPDENQSKDGYKFDYRLYYDVFVKNSMKGAVYASPEA